MAIIGNPLQSVAISCNQLQSVAISGNQRLSEAIRCNQMQSVMQSYVIIEKQWHAEVIEGNHMQSEAIRGHRLGTCHWQACGDGGGGGDIWQSVAISGNQTQSVANISGHQRPSEAIVGHQWQSVAISGNQRRGETFGNGAHARRGNHSITLNHTQSHSITLNHTRSQSSAIKVYLGPEARISHDTRW